MFCTKGESSWVEGVNSFNLQLNKSWFNTKKQHFCWLTRVQPLLCLSLFIHLSFSCCNMSENDPTRFADPNMKPSRLSHLLAEAFNHFSRTQRSICHRRFLLSGSMCVKLAFFSVQWERSDVLNPVYMGKFLSDNSVKILRDSVKNRSSVEKITSAAWNSDFML